MQYVRISLPTWKKIERVIREFDRLGYANPHKGYPPHDQTVLIRNDSSIACERFHILQISGVAIGPQDSLQDFQHRPVFTGIVPTDSAQTDNRLCMCAEPIAPGHIGRAWADGIVLTRVNVIDASHPCAAAKPNDTTQLESADQGFCTILYKESGTGTKWAVVRIGGGSAGGSGDRWAYLKQMPSAADGGVLDCRLDDPATGEITQVHFTLLNCSGVGEGHLSLKINSPVRVAKRDGQWWYVGFIEGTGETTCD